jgi:kynurenine formamidase
MMQPERLIDLTMTVRKGMRGVDYETSHSVKKDGWNARQLHLYSHSGTHMDAQMHFEAGDETIDRLPLARCSGPAWVVRLPETQPGELLTVDHLGKTRQKFSGGDSLLLHTGWSAFRNDVSIYRDGLPRISDELATWCVLHGVRMLGVEPPSVADVNNLAEVTRIHKILLGGKVTIVEGLTNLESLPDTRFTFIALPLKIHDGDGCPCRAIAYPECL